MLSPLSMLWSEASISQARSSVGEVTGVVCDLFQTRNGKRLRDPGDEIHVVSETLPDDDSV